MKILMLAMSMEPGGAETHILELSRELVRRGHTIFVASNGGAFACELEAGGVRHIFAPLHSKSPVFTARSLYVLACLCAEECFDIVHAHARIPAVIGTFLQNLFGYAFVTTAHGDYDTACFFSRFTKWGEHVFAVSEDIARKLSQSYAYPRESITLVPNGIDTARFCPDASGAEVREKLGLSGKTVVMYLGRLDGDSFLPAKMLAESAKELFWAHNGVKIVLVGGGEKRAKLLETAKRINDKLGSETVLLPGAAVRAERYIAACDVFVGPSRSAMEALACGKPTVVAGNFGTLGLFREEVSEAARQTNFCCRGFEKTTAENVKNAVLHALSLGESERKRLAEYGRNFICDHYSVRRMTDIYETEYKKLLSVRKKRVLFCGYYGYGNVGDEAMLAVLCRFLRASGVQTRVMSALRRDGNVPRFNVRHVHKALSWADVLVFGGGNILQDKTSALSLLYYALIARAARAHACKVAFTANGLGPFLRRKSLVLVKSALSLADYVSMREERSRAFAEFLTGKRVHLCADLAFAGEKAEKAFFCGEKYYAVFPKNVSKAEETELLRFFCAMRRHYGLIPVFVTLHKCEDRVICRTLAAKLPWAHYASDVRDEAGARALAKGACFTLAMRLHGAVFAVAEACPIIAAEGSEKTEAFFEGIGVPEGVRACKIHARLLCRAAAELLKTRKKSSAALKSAAEREMKKAQNELERLCAFIMQ